MNTDLKKMLKIFLKIFIYYKVSQGKFISNKKSKDTYE